MNMSTSTYVTEKLAEMFLCVNGVKHFSAYEPTSWFVIIGIINHIKRFGKTLSCRLLLATLPWDLER